MPRGEKICHFSALLEVFGPTPRRLTTGWWTTAGRGGRGFLKNPWGGFLGRLEKVLAGPPPSGRHPPKKTGKNPSSRWVGILGSKFEADKTEGPQRCHSRQFLTLFHKFGTYFGVQPDRFAILAPALFRPPPPVGGLQLGRAAGWKKKEENALAGSHQFRVF